MGKHVRGPLVVGASYERGVYYGNRVVLPGGWMKSHGIGNKDQVMIQTLKDQIVITPVPKKAVVPISKTSKTKKVSVIKRKYRKHLKVPVHNSAETSSIATIPVATTTETKITKAKSKKKGSLRSRRKVSKVTNTLVLS